MAVDGIQSSPFAQSAISAFRQATGPNSTPAKLVESITSQSSDSSSSSSLKSPSLDEALIMAQKQIQNGERLNVRV